MGKEKHVQLISLTINYLRFKLWFDDNGLWSDDIFGILVFLCGFDVFQICLFQEFLPEGFR